MSGIIVLVLESHIAISRLSFSMLKANTTSIIKLLSSEVNRLSLFSEEERKPLAIK